MGAIFDVCRLVAFMFQHNSKGNIPMWSNHAWINETASFPFMNWFLERTTIYSFQPALFMGLDRLLSEPVKDQLATCPALQRLETYPRGAWSTQFTFKAALKLPRI